MRIHGIKEEIKNNFFIKPTAKLRVRQIERELKLPLPSVIRYCRELEKDSILKKEIISEISVYSADRGSKKYLLEKKLFNLKMIFESGLVDYFVNEYSNPVIIVFGSYSKGEDVEKSDIDLYLQTHSKKMVNIDKFEKLLKRNVQLFIHSDIKQINNPHLMNNIINGIILNGFLEVFK